MGPLHYHLNLPFPVHGMVVTSSLVAFTVYDVMVSSGHCEGGAYYDNAFFDTLRHKTLKISETYIVSLEHIIFFSLTSKQSQWFGLVFVWV